MCIYMCTAVEWRKLITEVFICVFEAWEATELSLHLDNGNSTRNSKCTNLVLWTALKNVCSASGRNVVIFNLLAWLLKMSVQFCFRFEYVACFLFLCAIGVTAVMYIVEHTKCNMMHSCCVFMYSLQTAALLFLSNVCILIICIFCVCQCISNTNLWNYVDSF
jgi:hypothetical protein